MMKIPMSAAAAGLLRSLLARTGVNHNRILLIQSRSTEWQSLTFVGERHELCLRIPGPGAEEIALRLTSRLNDAEFSIPGQIVADICLAKPVQRESDGSIIIELEALTIGE
jgi:hypothetical protein